MINVDIFRQFSCRANKSQKSTKSSKTNFDAFVIDLLVGLLRGAVFHHGGVPEKLPISVTGAFPLLNGLFSNLNGPFPRMP